MEILKNIPLIASCISSISIIIGVFYKFMIKPLNDRMDNMCIMYLKRELIQILSEIEDGRKLDENELANLYDMYDTYTVKFKKNSYVHDKFEKIKKGGLL